MMAPKYIHRKTNVADRYSATVFHAIRFLLGDPKTHWYVNYSHPRIQLLNNLHWVQTRVGPVEIENGQWVVLHPTDGLFVMSDANFFSTFEPLSDYE